MSQIRKVDDAFGVLFSVEGGRDALADATEGASYLNRLRAIAADDETSPDDALRALLRLGAEWLSVEQSHLADIDLAAGTHTITEVSGPLLAAAPGTTRALPRTYCRAVLGEEAVRAVRNAPADGWAEDPAYDEFGARSYLGTKVVVDGAFYGTLCFVDREARGRPFTEAEAAAAELLARTIGRLLSGRAGDCPSPPTVAQFEALFEHSPNMISIHDEEGNLIAPNPHLCEKTGYTEDELTGMKVWDLDRDADPEAARAFWAEMEPGDRSRWEGVYERKDGSSFPVEVDLRRLDGKGAPRFITTSRDITERKTAEEALLKREELHRETLRNMTDTVFIARDDGTLTYVCPNVSHIFGYDRQEAECLETVSTLLGDDPVDDHDFGGDTELRNVEWRITDANGNQHDLLVNVRRVSIQEGSRMYTCRDVTERRKAEKQLQKEHDLLTRLFETSPAAIVMLNTEGEFLEASGRAEDVLGLERDAVTDRTYDDPAWHIRGPEGGPMPDEDLPFARVLATGEPVYDVEHQIVWPDGTHRLLSVSGAPLHAADGGMEGGVFHLDDITEQRAAKRALRKERDRFATLFHNLPTPVVHGRPDDGQVRVQAVNERFADVFGYEPDDIQGEPLQDLIVPEEKKDAAEAMPKRLLSGEPVNREERRRTADGLRDFRIQVALREGKKGPTEGFAIYTDVTERKERARMLARRKAILEAQAEATLDGLLVVDTDRRVVFFNDRFLDVWNVPAGPLNRSHRAVPFEEGLLEEMSALLPDPEAFRKEVEYLYDHPDKENRDVVRLTDGRWVDRYSAPIRVDDGDHFGRLWVFRDVTKQRQMMTRLLEVQEEERRRIDQEIHDEMGGLLTSLQFAVDLARRSVQGDGTPTDHFDQMEDIVSELSAVSRTISRKLYPNALSKRGLAEAFPDLIDKLEEEYHLDLDYYSEIEPGDRFSVPIERTMYWIVQETLMGIARRGDVDTAQVIVNERGEQLYLHIFDEGEGLSASARGKGRSFRFEAIRQRVEWLDGEVRVDSIPDEGTRLSVTLPIRLLFPTSRRTG